jgi:hypothetical protein
MMLLLPVLLVTTSPHRLTATSLTLLASGGVRPPHRGPVAALEVIAASDAVIVQAEVRRADVRARTEETTTQRIEVPSQDAQLDLEGLQRALRRFADLDPSRSEITVRPDDDLPASQWVRVLDAVREDDVGPLFPDVAIEDPR